MSVNKGGTALPVFDFQAPRPPVQWGRDGVLAPSPTAPTDWASSSCRQLGCLSLGRMVHGWVAVVYFFIYLYIYLLISFFLALNNFYVVFFRCLHF